MFPVVIRKEISAGMKQIFIGYKVADAKYSSLYLEYTPVCLFSSFSLSMTLTKKNNNL
jgi:hypothetical protein